MESNIARTEICPECGEEFFPEIQKLRGRDPVCHCVLRKRHDKWLGMDDTFHYRCAICGRRGHTCGGYYSNSKPGCIICLGCLNKDQKFCDRVIAQHTRGC